MGKKMDKMNIKMTGGIPSIAILLITGLAKTTRLVINPASISIGIGRFFQLVLKGINSRLTRNVAGSSSNWNALVLLLLAGDAISETNPVRAILIGHSATGNKLNRNSPFSINIGSYIYTSSPRPDIGYFRHRFT